MAENKLKTMCICGTRPELIRLSEVIRKLDQFTNHIFVHTNQSYDYELNQIFFDEMKIRKPDYLLNVKADTVGKQIGNILSQCEEVMLKEKPDAVVILGDTNSALSCIIAKRMRIPIFHLEAGNRCFDSRVPEEINRRIVDHVSDVNVCYTEHARRNLLQEGLPTQNIYVLGTPLVEVYERYKADIESSQILEKLKISKDNYIVASIHREENVNDKKNLEIIIESMNAIIAKYKVPIIFTTHPRTRNKIKEYGIESNNRITCCKPFGLYDYIKLQQNAMVNLSDSGSLHEDSAILNLRAIHIRESNERPEAYDNGNVIMSGIDLDNIINSVEMAIVQRIIKFSNPYFGDNFSDKLVRLIMQYKTVLKKEYYA
jgi:UDP-N-acetylglucosamine 2-epimerase (non-hydrolysing)